MPSRSAPQSWNAAYAHVRRPPRYEFGPGEEIAIRALRLRMDAGKEVSVVELGGGGGTFLLPFAKLGYTCYSIDFSEVGLSQAQALFAREGFELNPILADLLALPRDLSGRFDIVVSYGLCEHFLGQERQSIFDVHRTLVHAGGATLISVPNKFAPLYQLWWGATRVLTAANLARRLDVNIVSEWAFSANELSRRLARAGFGDIRVFGAPLLGDAVDLLARPTWKLILGVAGKRYRRPAFAKMPRTAMDDLIGSYFYAIGIAGPQTGGAITATP